MLAFCSSICTEAKDKRMCTVVAKVQHSTGGSIGEINLLCTSLALMVKRKNYWKDISKLLRELMESPGTEA